MKSLPRDLVLMISNYFAKIRSMTEGFIKTLEAVNSMDLQNAYKYLAHSIRMDTEADEIRREILEKISRNSLDAKTRDDVARLLRMMDRTSEWIKEALRYLDIVPYMEIPLEIRKDIEELAKLDAEAIDVLGRAMDMLLREKYDEVYKLCVSVEKIEERGDEALHRARKNVLKHGAKIGDAAMVVLLMDFVKALENALDYAEDVADLMRMLALRIEST